MVTRDGSTACAFFDAVVLLVCGIVLNFGLKLECYDLFALVDA
jgi:hypothetical protein